MKAVSAKLVKIGNSRGVRIPKALIDQSGLRDHVSIEVKGGAVILRQEHKRRAGWGRQFQQMAARGDDAPIIDDGLSNKFDQAGWQW